MKKVQFGESIGGNLKESTWEFEITSEDFNLSAGKFAIVPEKEYDKILEQRDRLLEAAVKLKEISTKLWGENESKHPRIMDRFDKLIKSIEDGE